jgi:hypothetical protein
MLRAAKWRWVASSISRSNSPVFEQVGLSAATQGYEAVGSDQLGFEIGQRLDAEVVGKPVRIGGLLHRQADEEP